LPRVEKKLKIRPEIGKKLSRFEKIFGMVGTYIHTLPTGAKGVNRLDKFNL